MGRSGVRTLVFVVVVLLIVGGVVALFAFRDRLAGSPTELRLGDCFLVPSGQTISNIQHKPCTDAHDGEVFAIHDYTGGDTFPTSDQLDAWTTDQCINKDFLAYTGTAFADRNDLTYGVFYPPEDAWASGQREIICYLSPAGGSTVTASYRQGQAAPSQGQGSPGASPSPSSS